MRDIHTIPIHKEKVTLAQTTLTPMSKHRKQLGTHTHAHTNKQTKYCAHAPLAHGHRGIIK